MLFNSIPFLLFFIAVFFIYYIPAIKNNVKVQNIFLLLASYFFYGYANWKMIPVLVIITLLFYGLGIAMQNKKYASKQSLIEIIGVTVGVALLVYFKYLNFLTASFSSLLGAIGFQVNWTALHIIMPLGVSYFTFKLISYVIEVYRGRMEPCRDLVAFATYVAFFPTIMAGPIDRPNKFIPQLLQKRNFNYDLAVSGCKLILWGLFMKLCIADRLGIYVDSVYSNYTIHNGTTLSLTAILYTFQMYSDFAGYSIMAIGVGKLLGLNITVNFNRPFFATNVAEFWRRWHISLTSWVTDYVFMPLNVKFRNWGNWGLILAVIINMVVIGFWHGANWTYGVFGLYQGLLFIPLILSGGFNKKSKVKLTRIGIPVPLALLKMLGVFFLYTFGAIIFRSVDVSEAFTIIGKIFTDQSVSEVYLGIKKELFSPLVFLFMLFSVDFIEEYYSRSIGFWHKYKSIRWVAYYVICVLILFYGLNSSEKFIYFQF